MPMPIPSTITPPTVTTSSDERIDTSRNRLRTHAITNSSTATTAPATIRALLTSEMMNGSVWKMLPNTVIAPFVIAFKQPNPEKLSAYECGFNAFDDARMKFDVRFYLVAILFIIFDLEVSFLFPWAVAFGDVGVAGFWAVMIFLAVLTIGFIYEWRKGALEWD